MLAVLSAIRSMIPISVNDFIHHLLQKTAENYINSFLAARCCFWNFDGLSFSQIFIKLTKGSIVVGHVHSFVLLGLFLFLFLSLQFLKIIVQAIETLVPDAAKGFQPCV
jgi:hypothetical protein